LQDSTYVAKSVRLVQQEMVRLTAEFCRLGLSYIPSIGNFVLVDVSPRQGKEVFKKLLQRGMIVRAMDEYQFPHHIRVSVGMPEENKFFIRCLKEVL
jgi:histidinol-phosphate aminotransferase